ncbi:MAG: hypothetical protein CR993_01510 [Rhodobacterales bacterium]|nr:MAG: hypothetical protein CR993_01510 [Rhodobacterales bacterium]
MRFLEKVLITISAVLLAGVAALAVFWGGVIAVMLVKGAPAVEKARLSAVRPVVSAPPAADPSTPETPAVAVVTASAGEKVFKKCKACHTVASGDGHKTGPNLWNIVGRDVAVADGFEYSDAMIGHAGTWTVDRLRTYLLDPKGDIPGNKMAFNGLKTEADANNLIAYLGLQADAPQDVVALGLSDTVVLAEAEPEDGADEVVEIDPVPYPEGVTYTNPPGRSPEEQAKFDALVADLEALAPTLDYQRARYHPLHFSPMIEEASNEQCLTCHQEILDHKPRAASIAGVPAEDTIAWYQTLDTYAGPQDTFHYRHLESDFAKEVMNLECVFCHKGNDPREETPDMLPTREAFEAGVVPEFTLRKMVNPSETCLRCHGQFPYEVMDLEAPWHEIRADMEYPEAPNGCLSCHAEGFRTVRHGVSYLNAANIEKLAREGSSDTCYGCHGGRAWYRISYPYPRHAWPDMDEEIPEWAVDRPTESDPEYALPAAE